jgi:hypothetical protein
VLELKRFVVILILAIAICVLLVTPAFAKSTAQFLKTEFLQPVDSVISATSLVNNWRWYGIDVLPQLVILTAETGLGSRDHGGQLVAANNFGCLRYGSTDSKWGALSDGKVNVAGADWFHFPTPEIGMMAWGRYLKSAQKGLYQKALGDAPYDWQAFADRYYGASVPGVVAYVAKLRQLEQRFRAQALAHGFVW